MRTLFSVSLIFVLVSLNAQMHLKFVKTFGETNGFYGEPTPRITSDMEGNSYTGSSIGYEMKLENNQSIYNNNQLGRDAYICKRDSIGNILWVGNFKGGSGDIIIYDIVTDDNLNVYVLGRFEGNVDFDIGVGEYYMTSQNNPFGFILKMDKDGKFIWAEKFGAKASTSYGHEVIVDEIENVYVIGEMGHIMTVQNVEISCTPTKNFLMKFDSNGELMYVRNYYSKEIYSHEEILLMENEIIMFHRFEEEVDLDLGQGINKVSPTGTNDLLITRVNKDSGVINSSFHFSKEGTQFLNETQAFGENIYMLIATNEGLDENIYELIEISPSNTFSSKITFENKFVFDFDININGEFVFCGRFSSSINWDDLSAQYLIDGDGRGFVLRYTSDMDFVDLNIINTTKLMSPYKVDYINKDKFIFSGIFMDMSSFVPNDSLNTIEALGDVHAFLASWGDVFDIVHIPDNNFKQSLITQGVDANMDGEIQVYEAENVDSLFLNGKGIKDLTGINSFVNVKFIEAKLNKIEELSITNLPHLTFVEVSNNKLTKIELLGEGIQIFNCKSNYLDTLDCRSLIGLEQLICSSNFLKSLSVSNLNNLSILRCNSNAITSLSLDGLHNVKEINCANNELEILQISDLVNLEVLICNDNRIESLDVSNSINCSQVYCHNNDLEALFIKNNRINFTSLHGNNFLKYICVDSLEAMNIAMLIEEEQIHNCIINSECPITSLGIPNQFRGKMIFSNDTSGCENAISTFPNSKLIVIDEDYNETIYSLESGDYLVNLDNKKYDFIPIILNPNYFDVTPNSISVDFFIEYLPYQQDFCITPNGIYNDLEVTVIPLEQARPGFKTDYKIQIANVGNTILTSDLQLTFETELMDFVSSSETPESVDNDEINWTFSEIKPFETHEIIVTFELNTPTETPPLNSGDVLHLYASVDSVEEDSDPSNNIHHLYQTVVNSYDPNDKTCLEGSILTPEMVGGYVHYMIRFENTGTTEAVNVVVRDSIDPQSFEISTLQIVDASHELETRINDGNIVEFIFKDIYLPFEDETNDGYVVFKIKTKDDLVLGDVFENKGEIYFDYNFPIITNIASTEVAIPLSIAEVDEINVKIMPNPTSGKIKILSSEMIQQLSLYNMNGQIIRTYDLIGESLSKQIDISTLGSGNYVLHIQTQKGMSREQITKI